MMMQAPVVQQQTYNYGQVYDSSIGLPAQQQQAEIIPAYPMLAGDKG